MGLFQKCFFTSAGILAIILAIATIVDFPGIMIGTTKSFPGIVNVGIHIPLGLPVEFAVLFYLPYMLVDLFCIVLILVGLALLLEAWNDGYLPFCRPRKG